LELTDKEKAEKIYGIWFGGGGMHSAKRAAHLHYKLDHAIF